jgi:hypothetical protein
VRAKTELARALATPPRSSIRRAAPPLPSPHDQSTPRVPMSSILSWPTWTMRIVPLAAVALALLLLLCSPLPTLAAAGWTS